MVIAVLVAAFPLALSAAAPPAASPQAPLSPGLLARIWQGVERAQQRHGSACGSLVETRVSPLLERPLVLRGSFCAAGLDRFRVEYRGAQPTRIVYNGGALNVSTDGGKRTTALDVGSAVRRTQRYFAGPRAAQTLERDFAINAGETADRYTLLLRPVAGRIAGRVKRVAVELGKSDFLPRRIEIDGKSGVSSLFEIEIDRLDVPLEEKTFEVYRP